MRKILLFLLGTFSMLPTHSQTFEELLRDGEAEFEKQIFFKPDTKGNYAKAIELLEKAAKMRPNNPAGHYALGCAYLMNLQTENKIVDTDIHSVMILSAEFEKVIKLAPKFSNGLSMIYRYSLINGLWGAKAIKYLSAQKNDSARWAFEEGKLRGAFSAFGLAYYRCLLNNCKKNSIYFCTSSYSASDCWYLQEIEHIRPDVCVVDLKRLQLPWYAGWLNKTNPGLFSSGMVLADTVKLKHWETKTFKIPIGRTGKDFVWTVEPTRRYHFLNRSDLLLIDIVRHNKFARQMYLEKGVLEDDELNLNNFVTDKLVAYEIVTNDTSNFNDESLTAFKTFPYKIFDLVDTNSFEEVHYIEHFRSYFLNGISALVTKNRMHEAKELLEQMKQVLPESKFPEDDWEYQKEKLKYEKVLQRY